MPDARANSDSESCPLAAGRPGPTTLGPRLSQASFHRKRNHGEGKEMTSQSGFWPDESFRRFRVRSNLMPLVEG